MDVIYFQNDVIRLTVRDGWKISLEMMSDKSELSLLEAAKLAQALAKAGLDVIKELEPC